MVRSGVITCKEEQRFLGARIFKYPSTIACSGSGGVGLSSFAPNHYVGGSNPPTLRAFEIVGHFSNFLPLSRVNLNLLQMATALARVSNKGCCLAGVFEVNHGFVHLQCACGFASRAHARSGAWSGCSAPRGGSSDHGITHTEISAHSTSELRSSTSTLHTEQTSRQHDRSTVVKEHGVILD